MPLPPCVVNRAKPLRVVGAMAVVHAADGRRWCLSPIPVDRGVAVFQIAPLMKRAVVSGLQPWSIATVNGARVLCHDLPSPTAGPCLRDRHTIGTAYIPLTLPTDSTTLGHQYVAWLVRCDRPRTLAFLRENPGVRQGDAMRPTGTRRWPITDGVVLSLMTVVTVGNCYLSQAHVPGRWRAPAGPVGHHPLASPGQIDFGVDVRSMSHSWHCSRSAV